MPTSEIQPLTVCVVGLGKIGLPLAVQYARRGLRVVGADIDPGVVDTINAGRVPFPGEADLSDLLIEVIGEGLLEATPDTARAVAASDVVVVVVPLVVDRMGDPDFASLDAATEKIAEGMTPGTLVIYETTVPVFTTRRRFVPALERCSGLQCGRDFSVAFSPERVYSGRIFSDLRRYPKLIGGVDADAGDRTRQFYEQALEFDERPDLVRANGVWDLGAAEAAELAKLAETTYRDINIAFANELAVFSETAGIDVFSVIEAANSQPFSHVHLPGIAVGGHCIPVYPRLFLSNAPNSRIPAIAREVNDAVPAHAVQRLAVALGGLTNKRIVVLGASYRGGVKETAFSGVFPLVDSLRSSGAVPVVHDPLYEDHELAALGLSPYHFGSPCEGAIVQADHAEYSALQPADLPGVRVILDGRHITHAERWRSAGVAHLQLGRV
jgi:nucleotide sugar dehydrogenase